MNPRAAISLRILTTLTLAILLVLAGCSSQPARAPSSYTVRRGDTLYSIAARYDVDYRELARFNGIGNDYRILVGQVIRFPNRATASKSPLARPTPAVQPAAPPPDYLDWHWPTDALSVAVTQRPNGGRGLTIGGRMGQDVRVAATGTVLYTGSGLLGYGQLIIVKHDDVYLSAYGHLQTVLVHEGERVSVAQKIATMGAGPTGDPLLYFEIRAAGQPLDPISILPQQQ